MKWQRLTILDFLLLMFSYAAAGGFLGGSARVESFLLIVVTGNNLAAFVVLPTQYVFRHRRSRLSWGELLWLCLPVFFAFVCVSSQLCPSIVWYALLMLVAGISSLWALVLICRRLMGDWGSVTCRWTDVFGSVACLSAGIALLYDAIADPVVI
jgi:hypothetical protein